MIILNSIPLKKSVNKAYLKIKPVRDDFDKFKIELQKLLTVINDKESEEHNKNFIRDFLINTFYPDKNVNTKGKTDLQTTSTAKLCMRLFYTTSENVLIKAMMK